jgi:oxygen-independent coproporphyrinogen-3 oxidase
LTSGRLPLHKGLTLSADDGIRKQVIQQLICHFELDFASMGARLGIEVTDYFARELQALEPLAADELLAMDAQGLRVSARGRLLIRRICMVFDAYVGDGLLSQAASAARYSRII